MARIAQLVVPGKPHQSTRRGNRRQQTFFTEEDYHEYIRLLSAFCKDKGVEIWAWCLMPDHVHIIAVRDTPGGPCRRHTGDIGAGLMCVTGGGGMYGRSALPHIPWKKSTYLQRRVNVELNPVKAGLAVEPEAFLWSSARAHIDALDDELVRVGPLLELAGDWKTFLSFGIEEQE